MRAGSNNTGIGQPVRRREDFRLLTGKGCYSDDYNFPGQAYAVMVRSPHAHAIIRSLDTAAAAAAPGVLAVLSGRDLLADGLQPILHSVGTRHPADITLESKDGSPPFIPPHFPMTAEEAHHCGEIVAMVVARTVAAAKDAAELVAVVYEPLPSVTHSLTAVEPDAPRARGDGLSNISIDAEIGDRSATNAAFARAATWDWGQTSRLASQGDGVEPDTAARTPKLAATAGRRVFQMTASYRKCSSPIE